MVLPKYYKRRECFMKTIDKLRWTVPEREMKPNVYDNYRKAQDMMADMFMLSISDFSELDKYCVPRLAPIRHQVPKEIYAGLTVCGLPVEEVGCGMICTLQAMVNLQQEFSRIDMEEIVSVIEEKGYYYPGRGLYWHWFNNFARRATHWYELIVELKFGNPVTVLIRRPGDTRNYFMNLLGVKVSEKAKTSSDIKFITSDEENNFEITLKILMEQLVTAPWIWC